jgi:hypothetical protein
MEALATQVETTTTCQEHNFQSWIRPIYQKPSTLLENPSGLVLNYTGLRENGKWTGKREIGTESRPSFPSLDPKSRFTVFPSFPVHFPSKIPARNMCHLESP